MQEGVHTLDVAYAYATEHSTPNPDGPDLDPLYTCPFTTCRKTFSKRFNLKAHLRVHTGDKPFACSFPGCERTFMWKSSLTSHEVGHSRRKSEADRRAAAAAAHRRKYSFDNSNPVSNHIARQSNVHVDRAVPISDHYVPPGPPYAHAPRDEHSQHQVRSYYDARQSYPPDNHQTHPNVTNAPHHTEHLRSVAQPHRSHPTHISAVNVVATAANQNNSLDSRAHEHTQDPRYAMYTSTAPHTYPLTHNGPYEDHTTRNVHANSAFDPPRQHQEQQQQQQFHHARDHGPQHLPPDQEPRYTSAPGLHQPYAQAFPVSQAEVARDPQAAAVKWSSQAARPPSDRLLSPHPERAPIKHEMMSAPPAQFTEQYHAPARPTDGLPRGLTVPVTSSPPTPESGHSLGAGPGPAPAATAMDPDPAARPPHPVRGTNQHHELQLSSTAKAEQVSHVLPPVQQPAGHANAQAFQHPEAVPQGDKMVRNGAAMPPHHPTHTPLGPTQLPALSPIRQQRFPPWPPGGTSGWGQSPSAGWGTDRLPGVDTPEPLPSLSQSGACISPRAPSVASSLGSPSAIHSPVPPPIHPQVDSAASSAARHRVPRPRGPNALLPPIPTVAPTLPPRHIDLGGLMDEDNNATLPPMDGSASTSPAAMAMASPGSGAQSGFRCPPLPISPLQPFSAGIVGGDHVMQESPYAGPTNGSARQKQSPTPW